MGGETTQRRLNRSIRIYQRSGLPPLLALLAKLTLLKSIQPLLALLPTPHDPQPVAGLTQTQADQPLTEQAIGIGWSGYVSDGVALVTEIGAV
ncbi:MAG: hypothetical protein ABW157_13290 [Candidatus Thiodiazotropha sp. LLP2]